MKPPFILILTLLFIALNACKKDKLELNHSKSYQLVGERDIDIFTSDRKGKMWFITSGANSFEEYAQTSMQAAIDMHKQHKKLDLIHIMLIPEKEFIATSVYYASAFYAVDNNGLYGLSGADQNTMVDFKWLVRSAEKPLDNQEFEIAKLWFKHQADFPSEDLLSSLGYNKEKLVKFISDSLNIEIDEVIHPQIILKDYTDF